MVTKLSPETGRRLRRLAQFSPKAEQLQKELETQHGISVSEHALKLLGADLGDKDRSHRLLQLKAEIETRTGRSFRSVRAGVLGGLEAAVSRLTQSAEGPPAYMGELISPMGYHTVEAERLKDATLLWMNTDLLVELNIATPAQANTDAFKQAFLQNFAYSVRRDEDQDDKFDQSAKKLFGADYQGGEGNWGTLGSGRAMSAGRWQIKGGGDTELSLKSGAKIGGLSLATGITEAIMGEINNHELPYGGNRILGLIATGTHTNTRAEDGETRVPRILAIREDPLRPSKFMLSDLDRIFDPEHLRTKANLQNVDRALPMPQEGAPKDRKARVLKGAKEYTRRLAEQYGTAFVKRLYHGATSPSNMQLHGGWLDYDLQTAQPGHGKINVLYSEDSFGENEAIKKLNIQAFLHDIFDHTEGLEQTEVQPFLTFYDREYEKTVEQEMLTLTGAPPTIAKSLYEGKEGQRLGRIMTKIARVPLMGNRRSIHIDMEGTGAQAMPERTSEYNVGELMIALAKVKSVAPSQLSKAIAKMLPDDALRSELVCAYTTFKTKLLARAHQDGVSSRGLSRLMITAAEQLNAPMTPVFRPLLKERTEKAIEAFTKSKDSQEISALIEQTIRSARRTMRNPDPYLLVLDQKYDEDGAQVLEVYDARLNRIRTLTEASEAKSAA